MVGGTFTTQAQLTVLTIDIETGSVLTVNVSLAGNYSVFPTNPAATTGGGGTGATFTLANDGISAITGAVVVAGGGAWPPGYRVGDVCQLEGGVYTAVASVVVTATTSGQVASVAIRTAGSGYSVNPCSPTPCIGGHGCGLKVTAFFTAGAMTSVGLADMGGPCHPPPLQWWQRTAINIYSPGEGPPSDVPKATVKGLLRPGWKMGLELMLNGCSDTCYNRPASYLWLPTCTDVNGSCCDSAGDVVEVPANSGRLYNVWWVEYENLDCDDERLLAILEQQCPLVPS